MKLDSLMLHYHLSILLLVDIIEVTCRSDLLVDLEGANTDAESTVMNCLVFGLQNTFTLSIKSNANSNEPIHSGATGTDTVASISVPLVSIDPYPHHVVAGVRLLRKAIDRDFGLGKIADDTHASLQSTLERTLSLLPQSSKSVQAARTMFSDGVLAQHQDPYVELHTDDCE